jgi:hypothetical protein
MTQSPWGTSASHAQRYETRSAGFCRMLVGSMSSMCHRHVHSEHASATATRAVRRPLWGGEYNASWEVLVAASVVNESNDGGVRQR